MTKRRKYRRWTIFNSAGDPFLDFVGYSPSGRKQRRTISVRSRGSQQTKIDANGASQDVADTESGTRHVVPINGRNGIFGTQETLRMFRSTAGAKQWQYDPADQDSTTQSYVGRMAHGIPDRVHRLKALGNAVVPQVAEFIGEQLKRVEQSADIFTGAGM